MSVINAERLILTENNAYDANIYLITGEEAISRLALNTLVNIVKAKKFAQHVNINVQDIDFKKRALKICQEIDIWDRSFVLVINSKIKLNNELNSFFDYIVKIVPNNKILIFNVPVSKEESNHFWYKKCSKEGYIFISSKIPPNKWQRWIELLSKRLKVSISEDMLSDLIYCYEGNLTALHQLLEMAANFSSQTLQKEVILNQLYDQAIFDIPTWISALLSNNNKRACRILFALKRQGVNPIDVIKNLQIYIMYNPSSLKDDAKLQLMFYLQDILDKYLESNAEEVWTYLMHLSLCLLTVGCENDGAFLS